MNSGTDTAEAVGCPIRIPTDQGLLAAPRGFAQRAASFIASQCQGIHQMPLSRLIPARAPRAGANPPMASPLLEDASSCRPLCGMVRPDPSQDTASGCCRRMRSAPIRIRRRPLGAPPMTLPAHTADLGHEPFFTICKNPPSPGGNGHARGRPGAGRVSLATSLGCLLRRRPCATRPAGSCQILVEAIGIEPTTSCLQSTRSPN